MRVLFSAWKSAHPSGRVAAVDTAVGEMGAAILIPAIATRYNVFSFVAVVVLDGAVGYIAAKIPIMVFAIA